jgi:hypothetical protein
MHSWVTKKAAKRADDEEFLLIICPYSSAAQLELALPKLASRGLRRSVDKSLEKGAGLTMCNPYQATRVLKRQIQQHQWDLMGRLVEKGMVSLTDELLLMVCKVLHSEYPHSILYGCSDKQKSIVLNSLVKRGLWKLVGEFVNRNNGLHMLKRKYILDEATRRANDESFESYILPFCSKEELTDVLPQLVTRELWSSVQEALEKGALVSACNKEQKETILYKVEKQIFSRGVGQVLNSGEYTDKQKILALQKACKSQNIIQIRYIMLPHYNKTLLICSAECWVRASAWTTVEQVLRVTYKKEQRDSVLCGVCQACPFSLLLEKILGLKGGLVEYFLSLLSSKSDLSPPALHSVALMFALQQRRWDVICQANVQHAWEQVRRELFCAAVDEGHWEIVQQWADNTLYHDQRWWALEEAYKHQQWGAMLELACHGLNEIEQMRVRYRLAMYADWRVVLRMFSYGVDVTEVRQMVENVMTSSRMTKRDPGKIDLLAKRWKKLSQLEKKLSNRLSEISLTNRENT